MQKVATISENIENENLQKLRGVFPQFVKDGAIDFDALQAFFKKEGVLAGTEKYGLSWAGKSTAFADIRRPATSTLTPLPDESKNWDTSENLFIEGENLEVLKLLQKKYANPGKIKMIYIDPPYNTGKDFIYTDNFTENKNEYYERTGQNCGGIKLTSNPESNGRYHSDWLTMMYPRLFLARNLLKDDGVIFVSIDDNEVANLRMIMDEIFGEENFVAQIVRRRRNSQANLSKDISPIHEYVVTYKKSDKATLNKVTPVINIDDFKNLDGDARGSYVTMPCTNKGGSKYEIVTPTGVKHVDEWRFKVETYENLLRDNRIVFPSAGNGKPRYKLFLSEKLENGVLANTWFDEVASNQEGTIELKNIFETEGNMFDNPKPIGLLKKIMELSTNANEGNLVLDFFAGSGTTAHAVMDLNAEDGGNRKWICVQVPEGTGDDSEACKVGYKTISALSLERIRRAGAKIAKGDVGFKAFSLSPSNYSEWNVLTDKDDEKTLLQQAKLFVEQPLVAGYDEQSVIYEILLKEGLDLNSKIAEMNKGGVVCHQVTDGDKEMTITFAKKLTKEQIDALALPKDTIFVCLDSALDDTTKVNIARNLMVKTI